MKTRSSFINFITAFIGNLNAIIIALISQKIFISILGADYLGLNGLFTNVISMLSIVELGIGTAIIYNLYKPISEHDHETIKSLMLYYKKAYRIVAVITALIGAAVIPFIPFFVSGQPSDINVYVVYILFVADAVFSYFLSYKRSILYADQKNYYISIIHIIYLVILNILQLSFLALTKNYYAYLIIKVAMRIIENLAISYIATRKYPFLSDKNIRPLQKHITRDITKKMKALFFHKIGTFVVLGSDNIIISRYLGLVSVGLYSNYYIIINALNTIFGQAVGALTPSVGHLLLEKNPQKSFDVFKKIRFMNFWISAFSATGLMIISGPFVELWLGSDYVLGQAVVFTLTFNYFQKMMRNSYSSFKDAAGIFHEDRFVPIVESAINIVASILLVKLMGLPGVFLGTIISGLALWCYSYPKFVYKKLFLRSYFDYTKETLGYIFMFLIIATLSFGCNKLFQTDELIINLLISALIVLIVPNLIITALFFKTENFSYFFELFRKALQKRKDRTTP